MDELLLRPWSGSSHSVCVREGWGGGAFHPVQHGKGPGSLCGTRSLGALWQYTKSRESIDRICSGRAALLSFLEGERITSPHEKLVLVQTSGKEWSQELSSGFEPCRSFRK